MAARKRNNGGNEPLKGGQKRSNNATSYNKKDMTHAGVTKQKSVPMSPSNKVSNEWLKKNRSTPSKGTYGTRTGVNKLK